MKKSFAMFGALAVLGMFSVMGCSSGTEPEDKGNSSSSGSYDCSVVNGVKVVAPEGGEKFKLGDKVEVVFGSDVENSGIRLVYVTRVDGKLRQLDMFAQSYSEKSWKYDGKTCNTLEFTLDVDKDGDPLPTGDAVKIRVIPYEDTNKMGESKEFSVSEK